MSESGPRVLQRLFPPVGVSTILGLVLLIVFAWNLGLLRNFPLYVDEPQWKLINSSLFNDNFQMRYFWPACSAGYVLAVPFTWIIPRTLDALLYGDGSNFMVVRPLGIATGLGIILSLAAVLYRAVSPRVTLLGALAIVVAFCSFGIILPLLVMNRPEQSLLVPFMAMMLIYAFRKPDAAPPSLAMSIVWCVVFSLLTSAMLAQHIKSFVLLPAAAVAGFLVIRRTWPFVSYLGISAFSFAETYSIWAKRTDCPELPLLQDAFNQLSLSPHLLASSPSDFFGAAIRNTQGFWIYILNGFFSSSYQSRWLPDDNSNAIAENLSNLMLLACLLVVLVSIIWIVFRIAGSRGASGYRVPSSNVVAMAIVLGLACLLPYQTTKNFYETALFWPLLLLAGAFAARDLASLGRRLPRVAIVAALLIAVAGQLTLSLTLQSYQGQWQEREASDAIALADAEEVGAACGLRRDREQTGLVVDNIAFRAFWATSRPVLADYVTGWWGRGLDIGAAAKAWPITAIIAQCPAIPADYRLGAKQSADGRYCCAQL